MIEYYLRTAFPGELAVYSQYVLENALPPLDDLKDKADALERAYAESFDSFIEDADGRAAETAERYFNEALSLRHALLGLFVLGLNHLFEQQISRIHALLPCAASAPFNVDAACDAIGSTVGVRPRDWASWDVLKELRCVANVAKHGEGAAAKKLRRIRPDLFQHPAIKGGRPEAWLLDQQVRRPLAGEDLYLERVDFERYAEATRQFWRELAMSFGFECP
jgi:hypothetical protein